MAKTNLTQNEQIGVEICAEVQKLCKTLGKNLSNDISENAQHLVKLYKLRRCMDKLSELLPRHAVIDDRTGKLLGYLYDNDYMEGVMMSTNIKVNSAIQHTEGHIRKISIKKYLL